MAGEYLIKIRTVLDKQDAKEIEDNLNNRFENVAEKFNNSLKRGLKRLGISGIITGAVYAMINDIDRLNSSIDETLNKYQDIKAQAAAQNLLPSEYWKLSRLSELSGVKNFDALFQQFRETMNKTNRGFNTPLNQFRGQGADANTFLQVLSSLQAADPKTRQLAAEGIFGQSGAADINKLLSVDLNSLAQKAFAGIDDEKFDEMIQRGIIASREQMINNLRREYDNLQLRSSLITPDVLSRQDRFKRAETGYENKLISNYDYAATVQEKMYEAQTATVSGINKLVDGVKNIYNQLSRLSDLQSQYYRGEITQEEYEQAQEDIFR